MSIARSKNKYSYYPHGMPSYLAKSPFTMWMAGKILIQDNENTRIIAWFADTADAKTFCDLMNKGIV